MKTLKCVYCGGPVVRSPEGEYVCSVCGAVQPSGVVEGVRGALSRRFDGASIEEYELPKAYIEARKRAIREWLREQYVRTITELEEAHYGWLWYFAAVRSANRDLSHYLSNVIHVSRLTKFILFVQKIVSSCNVPYPITEKKLVNLATRYGLKARQRTRIDNYRRYRETDVEILRDTLNIINTLKRLHCEKKCGGSCGGKERGRNGRSGQAPPGDGESPPDLAPD